MEVFEYIYAKHPNCELCKEHGLHSMIMVCIVISMVKASAKPFALVISPASVISAVLELHFVLF